MDIDVNRLMETNGAYLLGVVRDWLIGEIKTLPKPWQQMNEAEQQRIISRVTDQADRLVTAAVEVVAAGGRPVIPAMLDSIKIKDGVQATITMSKHDEHRHELFDAQGSRVYLSVVETSPYTGVESELTPEPDQPDLLGEAEEVPPPHDPETGEIIEPSEPQTATEAAEATWAAEDENQDDGDFADLSEPVVGRKPRRRRKAA